MMSYANYLGLVLKARNKIIPRDMEDQNIAAGVCFGLLLLAYPFFIAKFLHYNHKELDSLAFRKKYEFFYKEVRVTNRGRKAVLFYPLFLIKRWLFMTTIAMTDNTGI